METSCDIKIDEKLAIFQPKQQEKRVETWMKDKIITQIFKYLHNKLVIVPFDKTNGNDVFACQRHYNQIFIN